MSHTVHSINLQGTVVDDHAVASEYPGAVISRTERVRWVDGTFGAGPLTVVPVQNLIVTSAFTTIDPQARRYFLNQTYADVHHFFGLAPHLDGNKFTFSGDVNRWPGDYVVLGGPIDGVWHHWLIQWSARLSVLKMLRPDLLENPSVKFLVDARAWTVPFKEIFEAFGLPEHRFGIVDPGLHHQVPNGYMVSFLDQNYYYPSVMQNYVETVRAGFDLPAPGAEHPVRLFCSRQGFEIPKRRVANWAEVLPVLQEFDFTVVELGSLSAREQFRLFNRAEVVVGVHGADLAGMLFCPPASQLLIFENERNTYTGLAGTYTTLASLRGMRSQMMIVEEVVDPSGDYRDFGPQHNRDYYIDVGQLRRRFERMFRI